MIGTYDKVNNKNLIVADFYSDTSSTNMEWILRSVDAGGFVIFVFNNRLIQVAFSLQDEGNQILDGKLMNYYRMKDSYGVGMIYVTQSSNSSYINQYVIFKRFHHVIRDTFIPVLETTNYFAKPLFLAQGMYENKTGLHYHLMMEVKIKNPDGTNTTHLSNSRFLAEIDADPMIFTGHYLFPQEIEGEFVEYSNDDTRNNFFFKDNSNSSIKILESHTETNNNSPYRYLDIGISNIDVLFAKNIPGRPNSDNWITYIDNGVLNFAAYKWDLGADRTCIDSPSFTLTNNSQMGVLTKDDTYMEMATGQNFSEGNYNNLFKDMGREFNHTINKVNYAQDSYAEYN